MMQRILTVDDDALLRKSLTLQLEQAGFEVEGAGTGQEALAAAARERPDLAILDISLPDIDGHELLRRLREQLNGLPVIFLTGRRRQADMVEGLGLGADDYVVKPIEFPVLLARIQAVLRRSTTTRAKRETKIVAGDLTIDSATGVVTVGEKVVELPPRAFSLLRLLASRAGEIVPLTDILSTVWGDEYAGESQVVYVHIRWLREAIEAAPNHPERVVTVRGIGYKLVPKG